MKIRSFLAPLASATMGLLYSSFALASAPLGANPHGSVRHDGTNHVVYVGNDRHIYELYLFGGNWWWGDLTTITGAPLAGSTDERPFGYARADAKSSVVYVEANGRVVEIALPDGGGWGWGYLTNSSGAGDSAHFARFPMGYIRGDGVNAVVWDDKNNQIHETSFTGGSWNDLNVTAFVSAPPVTASERFPIVRTDGVSSIVFRSVNSNAELMRFADGSLSWQPLGDNQVQPTAYVRWDHVTSLLYARSDSHLMDRDFSNFQTWEPPVDLTAQTGAAIMDFGPWGYKRSDHINAIVYQSVDRHINEMSQSNSTLIWTKADLSSITHAPLASSVISIPYSRSDGVNSIPYGQSNGHIGEIFLSGGVWHYGDVTAIALH